MYAAWANVHARRRTEVRWIDESPFFPILMQPSPDLIRIGSLKSWMAPECVSINRLPMRATLYPFPSPQTARSVDREKTPWFQLLNGQWRFKAVERPESVA